MGLDTVEIVLQVEETFGVRLPAAPLHEVRTVGEFHEAVLDVLGRENDGAGINDEAMKRLRDALSVAKSPSQVIVNGETALSDLFPIMTRRWRWRRLAEIARLTLPQLEFAKSLSTVGTVLAIVVGWLFVYLLLFGVDRVFSIGALWFAVLCTILGLLTIVFWLILLRWLARPLAVCWPSGMDTLGDLARWVAREHYGELIACEKRFNSEEVWCILQKIVADVVGIDPNKVTKQSRFVEDLGAS